MPVYVAYITPIGRGVLERVIVTTVVVFIDKAKAKNISWSLYFDMACHSLEGRGIMMQRAHHSNVSHYCLSKVLKINTVYKAM